tara:strand:+ start:958 stop:1170 length:213 start_codon:yes stop_codon:yes gene_type:complete
MCALEQKKLYFKPRMLNTFPSEGGGWGVSSTREYVLARQVSSAIGPDLPFTLLLNAAVQLHQTSYSSIAQ